MWRPAGRSFLARIPVILFLFILVSGGLSPVAFSGRASADHSRSRAEDTDWLRLDGTDSSFSLTKDRDMEILCTPSSLVPGPAFDVFDTLNLTARRAVSLVPGWLNASLSWKFSELDDGDQVRFASIFTNSSLNSSYLDELAFSLAHLPVELLTDTRFDERVLVENVASMYAISRELGYADIVDSDGYSTVVYKIPGGTITLPWNIYYWYVASPRANLELPAYINETTFTYAGPADGVFWRAFLYNMTADPGYPVLSDYLANETVLWKGRINNVSDNGAVGAVSRWEHECLPDFDVKGTRTNQPVVHYKHHWGLCGENSELLSAAARSALIPCIPAMTVDGWHGWNEFYEQGWHQWEGYSGQVDNPVAEGNYGTVTEQLGLLQDSFQIPITEHYTGVATLTVNVRDVNGHPVDGATVKLAYNDLYNNPYEIGLVANLTDVWGNTSFPIGMNFDYYLHVYSPYGEYPPVTGSLVKAVTGAVKDANYTFNVSLGGKIAPAGPPPLFGDDDIFDVRYNITLESCEHSTKMYLDPFGYGHTIYRTYNTSTRLVVLVLDDTNLSLYHQGLAFTPARVLTLREGGSGETTVPSGRAYHIVFTGLYSPYTRTSASVKVVMDRFASVPAARILSPGAGTYLLGDVMAFRATAIPLILSMGPFTYSWFTNLSGALLSTALIFNGTLEAGYHNITFMVSNASGPLSLDSVHIRVKYPNRAPCANISLPPEGRVFAAGEPVYFSANGSCDPDRDVLEYMWTIPAEDDILGSERYLVQYLVPGHHTIRLSVSDPDGLSSTSVVNITVLEPNTPPQPVISSPPSGCVRYDDTAILLASEGTTDEDLASLEYTWISSLNGVISRSPGELVFLSPGINVITLWVNDSEYNVSAEIFVKVLARPPPPNIPPVPEISSPADGSVFMSFTNIFFRSNGTFDPDGDALIYSWLIDGANVSGLATMNISSLGVGEHRVTLAVFDGRAWVQTSIFVLITDRPPVLELRYNGTSLGDGDIIRVLFNTSVSLDASFSTDPEGSTIYFTWYVDGVSESLSPVLGIVLTPGNHSVLLEGSDVAGNVVRMSITLSVAPMQERTDDGEDGVVGDGSGGTTLLGWFVILLALLVAVGAGVYLASPLFLRRAEKMAES